MLLLAWSRRWREWRDLSCGCWLGACREPAVLSWSGSLRSHPCLWHARPVLCSARLKWMEINVIVKIKIKIDNWMKSSRTYSGVHKFCSPYSHTLAADSSVLSECYSTVAAVADASWFEDLDSRCCSGRLRWEHRHLTPPSHQLYSNAAIAPSFDWGK